MLHNTADYKEYNSATISQYVKPPVYAGAYRIGKEDTNNLYISLNYKPNRIHRFFSRVLIGWYWVENIK